MRLIFITLFATALTAITTSTLVFQAVQTLDAILFFSGATFAAVLVLLYDSHAEKRRRNVR